MIETINGKAYIKKGDKLYEVGGGGNANFLFANSKEELPDPSTVPENTVGLVPSEESAGGGLPVVELETTLYLDGDDNSMSDSDTEKLSALNGIPALLRFTVNTGGAEQTITVLPLETSGSFIVQFMTLIITFIPNDEDARSWTYLVTM